MSTEMVAKKTFEERMMDRVRDGIGELMTDEELKKIIAAGVEKAIFERQVQRNNYGPDATKPSLMDQMIDAHLKIQIAAQIELWIKANETRVQAAMESAIKAGIAGCVMQTMDERFRWIFEGAIQSARTNGLLKPI